MRTGKGLSGVLAAAAGIVFFLPWPVSAGKGDVISASGAALRQADSGREPATQGNPGIAGYSAECGKCHSPCEEGANHTSQVPRVRPGSGLPLDAEGRMGCLTCHDSHRDGEGGSTGARLRMSNLRRELCLACHSRAIEETPRVRIVSPLEGAMVQEDRLALIGKAAWLSGDLLTVRLNGAVFSLHVKQGHFFTWLKLMDGVNRIEVAQEDRLLWVGEVFRGGSALESYGRASSGHGTGSREECFGCHQRGEGMSAETTGSAPALCYGCHDRIDGKRFIHGPLAVGDCLVCHDPHGGIGSAHLRQEQGLLCRSCHSARESSPKVVCDASGKGCVGCHDPHQSDARYLLKGTKYTFLDGPVGRE